MMIVMGGTLTIAIMGANKVDGAANVWDIAKEDNRVNMDMWVLTIYLSNQREAEVILNNQCILYTDII